MCEPGPVTVSCPPLMGDWVTLHKPKELFPASVSVIAVTKKGAVRTPKDPDRSSGPGTSELD